VKYYKVYGYAPKGSIVFFCQAADENDVRKQFEAAVLNAKTAPQILHRARNFAWQSGFGQLIWDHPLPKGGTINLLFARPVPTPLPNPLEWGRHDYELFITEVVMNQITESP
jgi:hypothetical protein